MVVKVRKKGRDQMNIVTQMRRFEPIPTYTHVTLR